MALDEEHNAACTKFNGTELTARGFQALEVFNSVWLQPHAYTELTEKLSFDQTVLLNSRALRIKDSNASSYNNVNTELAYSLCATLGVLH